MNKIDYMRLIISETDDNNIGRLVFKAANDENIKQKDYESIYDVAIAKGQLLYGVENKTVD